MDMTKVSLVQIAAIVAALSTIIGAAITIDTRYAKRSDLDAVKRELNLSLDKLHKQILENEELKQRLGDNAAALELIAERNRRELADIRLRLARERSQYRIIEREILPAAPPPPPPPVQNDVEQVAPIPNP